MALRLATGILQKAMGPDQCISARADLTGESCEIQNRRWIGVWDSRTLDKKPSWLVSGETGDPSLYESKSFCEFSPGFDSEGDGSFDGFRDSAPARVPWHRINTSLEIAWWIEDHGLRAPLAYTEGIEDALSKGASLPYLDYSKPSIELAPLRQDPFFDCPVLYDCAAPLNPNPIPEWLLRAENLGELALYFETLEDPPPGTIWSEFAESRCQRNAFVLSNPINGGLKYDLSFLKTLDLGIISEAELQALYPGSNGLVNSDIARLIQTRRPHNPQLDPLEMGILPPPARTSARAPIYSLAPVLTEFRFSAGLAADANSSAGALFFVNKVTLELWNPYTVPLRVGDPIWPAPLGYSDLIVSLENLPRYTLTHHESGNTVSGTLPDLHYRWSDYAPGKVLRSGMVFNKSLPEDAADGGVGTRRTALNLDLPTKRNDSITAHYQFKADPVRIHLYAENSNGDSARLFTAEIKNYPDFSLQYQFGNENRHAWFQRALDSANGKYGMNNESLEVPGYAFTLRFKVLDRTRAHWQRYLTEYEFRKSTLGVNLTDWDPATTWDRDPPLPYDFRVNNEDCHPAHFNPAVFFSPRDLFHYENAGSRVGRRHRIVRACDAPTAEKLNPRILESLEGFPADAKLLDNYFFSTLPNPEHATWDGKQALFNARLRPLDSQHPPRLDSTATAESLLLHNGFNLNSTQFASWVAVLSGQSFPANSLKLHYEQTPKGFKPSEALRHLHFTHPQNAIYGLTEQSEDPAYELQTRARNEAYPACFVTPAADWRSQRQHPAFIQTLRELQPSEIEALAQAIIHELKDYYRSHGHPPLSLQSYLSSKILQKAIDRVPSLNLRVDGVDSIPQGSPTYFSQASLLNSLAPLAFVRSDTFTLHAAARLRHPLNGRILTEARCHARAQRLPELHSNSAFGRRFHSSHFRWESK